MSLINIISLNANNFILSDNISDLDTDIIALTETWLTVDTPTLSIIPKNYQLIHTPRINRIGGGIGILFKNTIKLISSNPVHIIDCDTILVSLLISGGLTIKLFLVYRPPSSTYQTFLDNLNEFISSLPSLTNTIFLGDFNIPINKQNKLSIDFISLMQSHSLQQHVNSFTHISGNTLDLVFSCINSSLIISILDTKHLLSDHYAVYFTVNYPMPTKPIKKTIYYRNISNISITNFLSDLHVLILNDRNDITMLNLNNCLSHLLSTHSPQKTKHIIDTNNNHWFNSENIRAKKHLRKAERCFSKNQTENNKIALIEASTTFKESIKMAKISYYHNKIVNCGNIAKLLYNVSDSLMGKTKEKILPDIISSDLCNQFSSFFTNKIEIIRQTIYNLICIALPTLPYTPPSISFLLSSFTPPSTDYMNYSFYHLNLPLPLTPIHYLL